jgi:hypothetical protein
MRALVVVLVILLVPSISRGQYRWEGHDFAFSFVSDDGLDDNMDWAQHGLANGYRFSIAVIGNNLEIPGFLTVEQVVELHDLGFDIMSHSYSHGNNGLPPECPTPPRGSMQGYWLCEVDHAEAMTAFHNEISRPVLAQITGLPMSDIRTFAFPRHLHSKAILRALVEEGYVGARCGGKTSYFSDSGGDFTTPAHNSWQSISLMRVPLANSTTYLFGDHDQGVYLTHEEFVARAQPIIDTFRTSGGICVVYDHRSTPPGSAKTTTGQDLDWLVDLVRVNDGWVSTFSEIIAYYRARSFGTEVDGDWVWTTDSPTDTEVAVPGAGFEVYPNPTSSLAMLHCFVREGEVRVEIFDLRGRRERTAFWGPIQSGERELAVDVHDLPSGVYFLRMQSPDGKFTRKMVLAGR